MRPLRTTRWPPAQLRRPVTLSPLFAHRTRQFHATRPNHILVGILSGAIDFLHGIHSVTGLPWAASIPLAALSVRTFIAFPILIWTRLKLRRRDDALPSLICMKLHYSKTIGEAALMNKLFMRSEDNVRELQKESQERISEWHKKWKIPRTSIAVVPLIQLPVWATMMEGIRHICGVEMGLFRYFSPANAIHGPQVQGLSGAEPTLASEGALWFSDLLAGDSTGILPLMLTFSILGNLRGSIATKTFAEASDLEKPQMIVQIFLKFTKYFGQAFAFYIGLMAYLSGMPTGLLLYWITSTNVATLQTLFVNNYLFVNKPMTAARQMHIRVLKPGEKPPPVKKLLQ